jgi:hypothetical protein
MRYRHDVQVSHPGNLNHGGLKPEIPCPHMHLFVVIHFCDDIRRPCTGGKGAPKHEQNKPCRESNDFHFLRQRFPSFGGRIRFALLIGLFYRAIPPSWSSSFFSVFDSLSVINIFFRGNQLKPVFEGEILCMHTVSPAPKYTFPFIDFSAAARHFWAVFKDASNGIRAVAQEGARKTERIRPPCLGA